MNTRNITYNTLMHRELLPPPISICNVKIRTSLFRKATPIALLCVDYTHDGRASLCLFLTMFVQMHYGLYLN